MDLQSLLPEHPLRDPKKGLGGFSDLDSWVLDEAVAAYTGTAASLQAALDIYKRNFFLAVSLSTHLFYAENLQCVASSMSIAQMSSGVCIFAGLCCTL